MLELIEKETLSKEDMARICAGVVKRPALAPYNGFGKRTPSDQPPVLTPASRPAAAPCPPASTSRSPCPSATPAAPQSR